ncbi:hypothetical protein PPL_01612 [Heterostelium album PN500]|uniref:Follistatin-like domain-containing protein n=1 Tax=Heterostelium pallidum (strain ATCC 26659 / Pp 5 / PN500) TaxID=670386 RepID=D3AZZ8_HETP5|nr:hypothetical protein PPL_01612 [Heterostelium album PN500]EFA84622.1 hypothetical protein PPL_01612 [Heterostelium album PN500]|eukprot:XP_020436735.1 hypothetical protein PPL_01612 [Heterostelium album PN500]
MKKYAFTLQVFRYSNDVEKEGRTTTTTPMKYLIVLLLLITLKGIRSWNICDRMVCLGGMQCVEENGMGVCVRTSSSGSTISSSSSSSSSSGSDLVCANFRCFGGLVCVNQNGVATCVKPGTSTSGVSSSSGSSGTSSTSGPLVCKDVKCLNGLICVQINGLATCIRPNPTSGTISTGTTTGGNVCNGVVCYGGLQCVNQNGIPTCMNTSSSTTGTWTSSGWYGVCSNFYCPHNYICASVHGKPLCLLGSCPDYIPPRDKCDGVRCKKGYKCAVISGTAACIPISTQPPGIDECTFKKCGPDEVCCHGGDNKKLKPTCINLCTFVDCNINTKCFVINRHPVCLPPNIFTTGTSTISTSTTSTTSISFTTRSATTRTGELTTTTGIIPLTAEITVLPTTGMTSGTGLPLTDTTTGPFLGGPDEIGFLVGGYVWVDSNRNGVRDEGEPYVDGFNVTVFQGNQFMSEFAIKDEYSGWKLFLLPGEVCCRIQINGNYMIAPESPFNKFAQDGRQCIQLNDLNLNNFVVNGEGEVRLNLAVYERQSYSIGGFAWNDSGDNNGFHETDEEYLAGVEVSLYDADSDQIIMSQITKSDYDGYTFDNVPSGNYCIFVETLPGYEIGKYSDYNRLPKQSCFSLNKQTVDDGEFANNSEGQIRFNIALSNDLSAGIN